MCKKEDICVREMWECMREGEMCVCEGIECERCVCKKEIGDEGTRGIGVALSYDYALCTTL